MIGDPPFITLWTEPSDILSSSHSLLSIKGFQCSSMDSHPPLTYKLINTVKMIVPPSPLNFPQKAYIAPPMTLVVLLYIKLQKSWKILPTMTTTPQKPYIPQKGSTPQDSHSSSLYMDGTKYNEKPSLFPPKKSQKSKKRLLTFFSLQGKQ